jgi:hypothetical protein
VPSLDVNSGGKAHIYLRIPGLDVAETRTVLCGIVRGPVGSTPDRVVCGYSLRPLARGEDKIDTEHIVECQMAGHVLVHTPSLRAIIRQVNMNNAKLTQQPIVVQNVLKPLYAVHNSDLNLCHTTHNINMKKEKATERALHTFDKERPADGPFEEVVRNYLRTGRGARDDAESSRIASTIARAMHETGERYSGQLRDKPVTGDVGSITAQGERRRIYEELSEELLELLRAMGLQ